MMTKPFSFPLYLVILISVIATLAPPAWTAETSGLFGRHPRLEICLNGTGEWQPGGVNDGNKWLMPFQVRVPGACQRDDLTQEIAVWYRKYFDLPAILKDQKAQWFIRFEKAGWYTKAFLNNKPVGENFGSYVPFEFDITEAVKFGQQNELNVFLHAAAGKFVLPGKEINDLRQAMSFRSGGRQHINWVQIEGNVTIHKRPIYRIDFHRVETSVTNKQLRIKGNTTRFPPAWRLTPQQIRAKVFNLNSSKLVLETDIPLIAAPGSRSNFDKPVPWPNPVLWGFGKYGQPHLYGLRLELIDAHRGQLDAVTSRFGFREIRYEGQTLMLNGKSLFISAAVVPLHKSYDVVYHHTYALFERNQIVRHIQALRQHGWNGMHNHFDTFGTALYDTADELGFLIIPGCFCAGPRWKATRTQCHLDWPTFMHQTFAQWAKTIGQHPSVIMWSLICGTPRTSQQMPLEKILAQLDQPGAVRQTDTTRPVMGADNDIVKAAFGGLRGIIEKKLTDKKRPRFVQEVWGFQTNNPVCLQHTKGLLQWLKDKNVSGYVCYGQTFPLFDFTLNWPSQSGYGVRWLQTSPQFPRKQFTGW
ncbi:MAG: sugar-binding domain-containing protein, partial [Planctomycetota bacterium]